MVPLCMIDERDIALLQEPTLQNRHLMGLGLSTRQVHVWCEQIGIGGVGRAEGRWRGFAPVDALTLNVVWEVKTRTNVALAKQEDLIGYLKNPQKFSAPAVHVWASGGRPILATDFAKTHSVLKAASDGLVLATLPDPLTVLLDVVPSVERVVAGVMVGGTDAQKAVVQRLLGRREALMSRDSGAAAETPQKQAPANTAGERIINLNIGAEKEPRQ